MKVNEKKEKGFTAIDLTIAMVVGVIFVSIMTSMIYSVYLSSTEAKRTANALNYAVDIFETIGAMDFGDVYGEGVLTGTESLGITSVTVAESWANAKVRNI